MVNGAGFHEQSQKENDSAGCGGHKHLGVLFCSDKCVVRIWRVENNGDRGFGCFYCNDCLAGGGFS
jgi:hypothetical protein